MKLKVFTVSVLLAAFLYGCSHGINTPETGKTVNTAVTTNGDDFINKQGPGSTGGLFKLKDSSGNILGNTRMKVLSVSSNQETELISSVTDNNGEVSIPGNIITPEIIRNLKEAKLKLLIVAYKDEKELVSEIKEIEFKADDFIYIVAETEAAKPVSVVTSLKSVNIGVGKTTEISADVNMSDGTKSNAVTWSSSDETVATIRNGKISGLKKGVTVITASATSGLEVYNKITVTVTDDSGISYVKIVDPTDKESITETIKLAVNENYQLEALAVLSDGTTSSNINWKSSDESVVAVGKSSGLVTGRSKGKATVTAFSTEDISQKAAVEVIVF